MKKRILIVCCALVAIMLAVVIYCNVAVVNYAKGRTYDRAFDIGQGHTYGLLLATSPITPGGAHNYYFDNRINAADSLYKMGCIKYIIASGGDYRSDHKFGCDEPAAIRDSLVARGVPADRIILDYEGLRTYNSIEKLKRNGIRSFVLISQKDHNERALSIANYFGYKDFDVVAYNAKPSHIRRNRIKNTLREYLARVKMYADFWTHPIVDYQLYEIPDSTQKQ